MKPYLKSISAVFLFLLLSGCSVFGLFSSDRVKNPDENQVIQETNEAYVEVIQNPTHIELPATHTPEIIEESTPTQTSEPENEVETEPEETQTEPQTNQPYSIELKGNILYGQYEGITENDCSWMGIRGFITDTEGNGLNGYIILVEGFLTATKVESLAVSGTFPDLGNGGYEIQLARQPIASNQTLWITLFDLEGNPVSDIIPFDTFADCGKNLILADFIFRN